MSNHTKTPWDFKTDRLTGDCGFIAEGTGIFAECFADIRHGGENAREECLANAELVKIAVNSHEALVKALKWIADNPTAHPANMARVAEDALKGIFDV